ncbi:cardiolipin synthase [Mollicutes bacterium LVI A0039]|nr:cardiolipin synthase [Mollicutes bacterium LVI A0039]
MKKANRHYLNIIKVIVVALTLFIQISVIYLFFVLFTEIGAYSYFIIELIGVLIALRVLGSNKKYIYKLSWTVFLVIIPVSAIVFYLLYGNQRFIKKIRSVEDQIGTDLSFGNQQNDHIVDQLENKRLKTDINSIYNLSKYPVYQSSENKYFKLGEEFFEDVIEKLENAEKFILIEFYIIARGELYERITDILIDKVKSGVEVYMIYDKLGSLRTFGKDEVQHLTDNGIKIVAFNKDITKIYRFVSYRTHRKIIIVDGKYTYTGGNNLADEYINIGSKYGHWKDMGIRVQGPAANSFIYAFFKSWVLLTQSSVDIKKYVQEQLPYSGIEDNIVVPFTDEPTNDLEIASHNYMRIIANSTDYVYITTPYLIIDEEMISSLKLAAKSGVDVRIILPGIADKKFIYEVSMAHCLDLILAGVKVYRYNPGFIHGKTIVSDDYYSTVGSVNFDYRSLMWNYECAIYAYDSNLAKQIREDFEGELKLSTCINEQYLKDRTLSRKILNGIFRLIGPLF